MAKASLPGGGLMLFILFCFHDTDVPFSAIINGHTNFHIFCRISNYLADLEDSPAQYVVYQSSDVRKYSTLRPYFRTLTLEEW
jgi:hypothetical protein